MERGARAPLPRGLGSFGNGRSRPVDLHIVVGQVTAPRGGRGLAVPQADIHRHLGLGQHGFGGILVKGDASPVFADLDLSGFRDECDIHAGHVHLRPGIPDGAEYPAPVGVGPEDRRLEQGGSRYRPGGHASVMPGRTTP